MVIKLIILKKYENETNQIIENTRIEGDFYNRLFLFLNATYNTIYLQYVAHKKRIIFCMN